MYGGTKKEMERLLADATKLTGVKYNIDNLADVYTAVGVIQDQLGITGTTALEAEQTISGSLNAMKSSFTNVLGNLALGEDLTPSLNALAETTSTFLFNNFIPMVWDIVKALPGALITFFTTAIPIFIKSGGDMIKSFAGGFSENVTSLGESIKEAIPVAIDSFIELVDKSLGFIADKLPDFLKKGLEIVGKLAKGLWDNLPHIIKTISDLIIRLVNTISSHIPKFIQKGMLLIVQLGVGLIKAIPGIVAKIPQIISAILKAFGGIVSSFFNIGKDIIKGLWNGIASVKDWIMSKISGFVDGILGGVKKFFGIKSPSRVMANEVGKFLPSGLAVGVEANTKPLLKTMEDLSVDTVNAFDFDSAVGSLSVDDYDTGNTKIDNLISMIEALLNNPAQYQVVMDTGVVAGELTPVINRNLANEETKSRRGR